MAGVVKSMDSAMRSMNLEKVPCVNVLKNTLFKGLVVLVLEH